MHSKSSSFAFYSESVQEKSAESLGFPHERGASAYSLESIVYQKLKTVVPKLDHTLEGDLYQTVISMVERPLIELVLQSTRGNQCKAADILGINRNTLRKKISLLGIEPKSCKGH